MEDVFIMLIIAITGVSIVTIIQIKTLIIKREQIKADALVRAEEVKAKNQLEIEKLIHSEQLGNREKNFSNNIIDSADGRSVREKLNS